MVLNVLFADYFKRYQDKGNCIAKKKVVHKSVVFSTWNNVTYIFASSFHIKANTNIKIFLCFFSSWLLSINISFFFYIPQKKTEMETKEKMSCATCHMSYVMFMLHVLCVGWSHRPKTPQKFTMERSLKRQKPKNV